MPTCYRHPDRPTGLSCSECGRPICTDCMTPAPVGLRCPDHSGKPQGVRRITAGAERAVTGVGSRRVNLVTMILVGINIAVYLLELALGGTVQGTSNWLFSHGALVLNGVYGGENVFAVPAHVVVPPGVTLVGIAHGEWWRLITAAFLHYGPFHLFMNMLGLYWFGSLLEQRIGSGKFLLLYLVSGLAGSAGGAGAVFVSPNVVRVGASGAIFGILGGLFLLERRGNIATGGQIAGLIVINLIFTFALASHISVGGHVGGLIGGFVLMLLLVHFRRSTALAIASSIVVGIVAVAVAYAKARGYT